jgi:hypothetical protein
VPDALNRLIYDQAGQVISSSGLCWDAEFPVPPTKLTSEAFKDKGD